MSECLQVSLQYFINLTRMDKKIKFRSCIPVGNKTRRLIIRLPRSRINFRNEMRCRIKKVRKNTIRLLIHRFINFIFSDLLVFHICIHLFVYLINQFIFLFVSISL